MEIKNGRIFRAAWIAGVTQHHPGEPKPGYVTPWDETPEWEQQSAATVYDLIAAFIEGSGGATLRLTRAQKGQFVAVCWAAQIHRHIPNPKPSYVAAWDDLPNWQQETDADIFEHIEQLVTASKPAR
jgi:hypothetical protein